jgi:hypothetical protein
MKKKDNKSFWNTLPGILTGIAGIIGAIAALAAILPPPQLLDITITSPKDDEKVQGLMDKVTVTRI